MANAFTLTGSTPNQGFLSALTNNGIKPTPQPSSTGLNTGTINNAVSSGALTPLGTNQGVLNQPKPTTPVKSVSTTSPTGAIQTTTYHAPTPAPTIPSTQSQTYNNGANLGSTSSPTSSGYTGTTPAPGYNADGTNKTLPIDYSGTNQGNPNGLPGTNPLAPPVPYTPQTTQGQYISDLANKGQDSSQAYKDAQLEADYWQQQQDNATRSHLGAIADIKGSGTWTSRALGEQGIENERNIGIQDRLAQNYNAAVGRLAAANTQQGLQQGALSSAVGANAPQFPGYQTPVYNPSTDTFTNNPGGAFYGGQNSAEADLGKQYAQNASAFKQSAGVKNNIVNFLNTTPLNPNDFKKLNEVTAFLSGQVSDPKYAQLSSQINEYLQTLAPILGVGGGDTNYKTQLAQGMLDGGMTPQAIVAQLNTIENTAKTKLSLQATGSGTTNPSNTQTGSYTSNTGVTYKLPY